MKDYVETIQEVKESLKKGIVTARGDRQKLLEEVYLDLCTIQYKLH